MCLYIFFVFVSFVLFFFFFKQKTAYELRISDWSSDVCSSDLFLVRQISLTADGREIVRAAMIAKPQLSLGRAAESDIHLPDLALEPDHARIEQDRKSTRLNSSH